MENSTTTPNYFRFDRQAIFNSADMDTVMDAISEARIAAYDSKDEEIKRELRTVGNQLFGLYDGYLYDNVFKTFEAHIQNKALVMKFKSLINKICLTVQAQEA